MTSKMLKITKRMFSLLATIVMVSAVALPVNAADETKNTEATGIVYAKYEDGTYEDYMNNRVAPEYVGSLACGYVFGGWFTSANETTFTPIVNTANISGAVYAKFVPARVLSVKCQNKAGTVAGMQGTTSLKIVSALDSANYKSYGFELDYIALNSKNTIDTGKCYSIKEVYTLDDAYTKFNVYSDAAGTNKVGGYEPKDLFGNAATYFTTYGVKEIASNQFDAIVCIKPCWTTLDGTKVYGLTKYAHVEDGLLTDDNCRYVNVPINLRKAASGVAAGVLSVNYKDLTFVEVEGGRYFEEMAWADKGTSVKLVGNTANISDKNDNDIYANIRFKVADKKAYEVLSGYEFTVNGEDFSDSLEKQTTPNVWDVFY